MDFKFQPGDQLEYADALVIPSFVFTVQAHDPNGQGWYILLREESSYYLSTLLTQGKSYVETSYKLRVPELKSGDQKSGCDHEWVNYLGFRVSYRYCNKCDLTERPNKGE